MCHNAPWLSNLDKQVRFQLAPELSETCVLSQKSFCRRNCYVSEMAVMLGCGNRSVAGTASEALLGGCTIHMATSCVHDVPPLNCHWQSGRTYLTLPYLTCTTPCPMQMKTKVDAGL